MEKNITRLGNPVLRQDNAVLSAEQIKSPEFKSLVQDMHDTMVKLGGIGIAAPQIGINKQVCLIEIDLANERYDEGQEAPLMIIVNPVITVLDETLQGFWEGCLSVPGLRGFVERPQKIQVDFLDDQAQAQSLTIEGFLATVFQHEIDHLFGILYIDKVKHPHLLSFDEEFIQFHAPKKEED